jgi:Fe-S-cluster containining protein
MSDALERAVPVESEICRLCGGRCCQSRLTVLILQRGEDGLFTDLMPVHDDGHRMWVQFDETANGRCPHLADGWVCSIWDRRPANCQAWPYPNTSVSGCPLVAFRQPYGQIRIGL